ncbi:MAG: hypothetical protein LBJ31_02465 [Treponema sp.]|jgi:uncharacterized protein (DUF4415 family)|nr:hypothetical protein [Treponema sp.]
MLVTSRLKAGAKPAGKQIERIRKAARQPVTFDEDCPELTTGQLGQLIEAARLRNLKQTVGLRLNPQTIEQYKAFGKGYTRVMASVLEYAIKNPSLIKKAL